MHAERDFLVKQVFPELREWCDQHKLNLIDIDLRWGVTEQDATQNKRVVQVCLDRIDECRPFFLCFLGQRRGWVPGPDDIAPETWDAFPELKKYMPTVIDPNSEELLLNPSVTEMEILHALINPLNKKSAQGLQEKPEASKYAFFYLRDGNYLQDIPTDLPQLREIYTNESIHDPLEREKTDQKLALWREQIIPAAQRPVRAYRARWDLRATTPELAYALTCPSNDAQNQNRWRRQWAAAGVALNADEVAVPSHLVERANNFNQRLTSGRLVGFEHNGVLLKQQILEDLKQAITERFPDHMQPVIDTPLQREIDQQQQFLRSAGSGFIERAGAFRELDAYLASASRAAFSLAAPGGMGKSMLLASWVARLLEEIPPAGPVVLYRFIGVSDGSTRIDSVLRSVIEEAAERFNCVINTDLDSRKLRENWVKLIAEKCLGTSLVLVFDSINQLETGLSDLQWLPETLPEGIKLVLSLKTSTPDADELILTWQKSGRVQIGEIEPFRTLEDRRALVETFLKAYFKELDGNLLEELIRHPATQNPLYLKILLSELRIFGDFNNLKKKIQEFGQDPVSAFSAVLHRLETDPVYSRFRLHDMIPRLFGFLAASRKGLSVGELAHLLIQTLGLAPSGDNLDAAAETINLYLRQMRPFLARRDNRYDLFYESFRQAALLRYRNRLDQYHGDLAAFFIQQADPSRQQQYELDQARPLEELPYHLAEAKEQGRLAEVMSRLTYLDARCRTGSIYTLLDDYQLTTGQEAVQPFIDFLRKNAQKLSRYPNLLFSLARFEGSPPVAAQAARLVEQNRWKRPYIQLTPLNLPEEESSEEPDASLSVLSRFDYPYSAAVDASTGQPVSFWVMGLGKVGILDTLTMEPQNQVITTARSRPLAIFCSPNADYLALAYDDGSAEVIALFFNPQGKFLYQKSAFRFEYHLPEVENPVFCWHADDLWYQPEDKQLAKCNFQIQDQEVHCTKELFALPIEMQGEINLILPVSDSLLIGARQGNDTSLSSLDSRNFTHFEKRLHSDILCAAVSPDRQRAAVVFSDRKIQIYAFDPVGKTAAVFPAPDNMKAVGWVGNLLYLVSRGFEVYLLDVEGSSPARLLVEFGTFYPLTTVPDPWCIYCRDGSSFECTTHTGVIKLTPSLASARRQAVRKALFTRPDENCTAVVIKGEENEISMLDCHNALEYPLAPNGGNLFVSAVDGNSDFFTVHISGLAAMVTAAGETFNFHDIPPGIISLAGDPLGGFYGCEENGEIYHFAPHERATYNPAASLKKFFPGGSALRAFEDCLVWKGVSEHAVPGKPDAELLLVFFKAMQSRLQPYATILFLKSEGHFSCFTYDSSTGRLMVVLREEGRHQMIFRYGTIDDFQSGRAKQIPLPCGGDFINKIEYRQANSAGKDMETAYLMSLQGNLFVLDITTGRIVAALAPETPLTNFSVRQSSRAVLYCSVNDHSVYQCNLETNV